MKTRFNIWADRLKNRVYALYLATKDPRVPWPSKLVIGAVVAYALSPIDLIPDFIPVLGYVDDILILPAGIWLAIRLIPPEIWDECLARATKRPTSLPRNRVAAVVIMVLWVVAGFMLTIWIYQWITGSPSEAQGSRPTTTWT